MGLAIAPIADSLNAGQGKGRAACVFRPASADETTKVRKRSAAFQIPDERQGVLLKALKIPVVVDIVFHGFELVPGVVGVVDPGAVLLVHDIERLAIHDNIQLAAVRVTEL